MAVTTRLVFDVTDADTIAASSSVGAFVRAADGTLIGHVSDALKVNFTNSSLAVTATDLDIRDLTSASDSIAAVQSGTWNIGTLGTITNVVHVDDNSGSLTVDGTVAATQSGSWTVAATQSGTWSATVTATDLDIRDLNATSDAVAAYVKDGSGNAIGSTSGALNVYMSGGSIDVQNEANTAIENTAASVTTTSAALLSSQLANRKFMFVQNLGSKLTYIGKPGVSAANGMQLAPGMIFEFELGPALSLHAVSQAGTQDVRVMELS